MLLFLYDFFYKKVGLPKQGSNRPTWPQPAEEIFEISTWHGGFTHKNGQPSSPKWDTHRFVKLGINKNSRVERFSGFKHGRWFREWHPGSKMESRGIGPFLDTKEKAFCV